MVNRSLMASQRLSKTRLPKTRHVMLLWAGLLLCIVPFSGPGAADPCAEDDQGKGLCLTSPARRIAALSPGATELAFAAGAGDRVVAVVAHSDYPPAAKALPSVGNHQRLDLEALLALQPDLVIGWASGNPSVQLDTLAKLGIPVFMLEPDDEEGIASAMERLADLAGTASVGHPAAARFRARIQALKQRYAGRQPVTTFFQVWDSPLMSVNDQHLIGQVIRWCGGDNIVGDQPRQIPRLSEEVVIARDPAAIVAPSRAGAAPLARWRRHPQLAAVSANQLLQVPESLILRPTPRLADGAAQLCEQLDRVRRAQ